MSRIRSSNTKPELRVRSVLHHLGYRFRLHSSNLPGKPDIVLPKWKHIILVHGCFWHRHERCKFCYTPKSRTDFWNEKFSATVRRDATVVEKLKALGWRVSIIWECQTDDIEKLSNRLESLLAGEKILSERSQIVEKSFGLCAMHRCVNPLSSISYCKRVTPGGRPLAKSRLVNLGKSSRTSYSF